MRRWCYLILLAVIPALIGCETQWGPTTVRDPAPYKPLVKKAKYDVPVVLNEHTAAWIDFYQTRGRKHFARHLGRSSRYIPLMQKILRENGLPEDIVYIAMIESGFSARAHSHANAVGFWQFIRATGRRYDLRIDQNVDERRDFERATQSAANYLKDLYAMFGDWYVAFAAYNAGEGKLSRAIKRYGTKDFWRLREGSYLKRETKNYVPKFLAAMIIAKDPEKFGFHNIEWQEPFEYEKVTVTGTPLDLRVVAALTETDIEEIKELNPELKIWFTPPDRSSYALRVPKPTAMRLRSQLASMPDHLRMSDQEYVVGTGESLQSLAKRHKLSVRHLAMANGLKTKSTLQPGQLIGIPHKPPKGTNYFAPHTDLAVHRVRNGDSLWKIARRYNVSIKQLQAWNKGRIGKYLRPGQKIYVSAAAVKKSGNRKGSGSSGSRPSGTITYRVRSGDSLWSVANKHGVTIAQLKAWNEGKIGKYLKAGQKLTIRGSGSGSRQAAAGGKKSTYVVRSGDTLSTIAQRHGVRTADIRAWNKGRLGKYLKVGQRLTLQANAKSAPAANRSTAAAPSSTGSSYRVRSGDSLWSIAQKHNVSVSDLKAWNGNDLGRYLKPGQRIAIRKAGATTTAKRPVAIETAAVPTTVSNEQRAIFHTIASGDTLWDIARKYGVSTKDIKTWNGIEQVKRLRPGDKIKIYVKKKSASEEA